MMSCLGTAMYYKYLYLPEVVTLLSAAHVESRLFLCVDIVMAARLRRSNPTVRVGILHGLARFAC
jgi:hypothetical protein